MARQGRRGGRKGGRIAASVPSPLSPAPGQRAEVHVSAREDDADRAFPCTATVPSSRAARGTAAEGSITSFMRSQTRRMADTMDSSSTVTIARTSALMIGKVSVPSDVRSPSAMVRGSVEGWMRPSRTERNASSAPFGSTAYTDVAGEVKPHASSVPLARPPPPTGTRIASSGPACSSSSSAHEACPAITRGSL